MAASAVRRPQGKAELGDGSFPTIPKACGFEAATRLHKVTSLQFERENHEIRPIPFRRTVFVVVDMFKLPIAGSTKATHHIAGGAFGSPGDVPFAGPEGEKRCGEPSRDSRND